MLCFLKKYFADILSGKTKLHPLHPITLILRNLSLPYLLITQVRIYLYKIGVFSTHQLGCPVISVGNLTLGGTGKTPVVEYIARFFLNKGLRPVVLTRGYGRPDESAIAVVSNGKEILLKPVEAGDEPYLLAENNPTLPIVVGKNRFKAGKEAINKFNPDVIILDDGFQYLSLARDLNVVLLNSIRSLENSHIFPAGNLREPVSALNRADVVLYTHADELPHCSSDNLPINKDILKLKTVHSLDKIVCLANQKMLPPEELSKKKTVLFCGIGEPDSFRSKVEQYEAEIVYFKSYPDHYVYKLSDLRFIHKIADELKADYILTTQKDAVKIKDIISAFPAIHMVQIKIEFSEGEDKFQEALLSMVL